MEPGHAAVRYVNPTTGGDFMPTLRDWQSGRASGCRARRGRPRRPSDPSSTHPGRAPRWPALQLTCLLDGEVVQKTTTADLVLSPVDLVRYASTVLTLRPAHVIATGTPGGPI